jgi:chorismate synthase
MNRFGIRFSFSTFGESHGIAIGVIVDGVPAGLEIDEDFIQKEVDRRRPGQNQFATTRKESDKVEILSGVFEGKSTGTPIAMIIYNENQKSKDYSTIKDLFRPGHADFTYHHKYGNRDYRGGGRSSARETAVRVAAGAIAKLMLKELKIEILSGVSHIAGVGDENHNFEFAKRSEIFSLSEESEAEQKRLILEAKEGHDSLGGTVVVKIKNLPIGLGEPLYYKLDAILADAMMGINGVKGIEIGLGREASLINGSENNDQMNNTGFLSNHAGGVLGGISNGDDVDIKVHFKPTPSIFLKQQTLDIHGANSEINLKGRHDPVIAVRGSIVAEAMANLVIADLVLLNMGRKIVDVKRYYREENIRK